VFSPVLLATTAGILFIPNFVSMVEEKTTECPNKTTAGILFLSNFDSMVEEKATECPNKTWINKKRFLLYQ